ncbi:MAG: glycosyltransferase family 4 protein [Bryobacterales bacterium]|nr:glycosyltransferase family 4 protein [Bryobacterales bacterium]
MRRTILHIAYPLTPVSTDTVGGSEQMLALLDRELTAAGHDSLVLAAAGSKVAGRLIASPPAPARLDDEARRMGQDAHAELIRDTLSRYPVDLIHMHALDFWAYLPGDGVPTLTTLHLPPDWYPDWVFRMGRREFYMNCVSYSQHRSCPSSQHLLPPILNGVDVARFGCKAPRRGYVLALGRICPEKGFHHALDAAKEAGVEMILAGEVFPYDAHLRYFEEEIRPRLDNKRRFIGPVGFEKKRRLLGQARCLLVPSTVAETCSLVSMEALASGTPVVAYRSGALPEVVEHGVTGYVVSGVEEMAEAIGKVGELQAEVCRRAARERFSSREMVQQYFNLYQKLTASPAYLATPRLRPGISWLMA